MASAEPVPLPAATAPFFITNPATDRYNALTLISWLKQEVFEAKIAVYGD